ncbi:3-oxoacyl-ACP synthase III family protein [Kibdelosporangium phytohabitans]|uniref:3-oxoacyl-ACP synthase n=1 Tax=Kibdelosporangium phytohabitans TaxID=860235 RepID=A0A0N9I7V2_9PSEU|nr:ketoacyl-ACP synthase III [Kibdelosporangium phytohabitans]ALG10843.1 3-oxoacyl-ACP synthase [Kibdelosporangium phytohabitans]MBE1462018.1 3-oxoacyl-[acyl-carrier-protein] synthase-3 [Kibdelosporangium phytohabitans]
MGARLVSVAVHLPGNEMTTRDTEARIGPFTAPAGVIDRLTGVRSRHVLRDDEQASDLAVAAARKVLAESGTAPAEVDLLLFASASQDMVEPATAHIVAAKLDLSCPVMDVKNACNSVLNGIEVATALIETGRYRTVLIASGEAPSRAVRWKVGSLTEFLRAFPGYTLSDAGAALLLTRGEPGVLGSGFTADSTKWDIGTLPGGGSQHPRDPEYTYFSMDGARLKSAFLGLGSEVLTGTLDGLGLRWEDFAVVCVHQVSLPYLEIFAEQAGVPRDKLVVTLPRHGNVASVSLPLQLVTARELGRCGPGDLVALVGLAGGVSLGIVVVRL